MILTGLSPQEEKAIQGLKVSFTIPRANSISNYNLLVNNLKREMGETLDKIC